MPTNPWFSLTLGHVLMQFPDTEFLLVTYSKTWLKSFLCTCRSTNLFPVVLPGISLSSVDCPTLRKQVTLNMTLLSLTSSSACLHGTRRLYYFGSLLVSTCAHVKITNYTCILASGLSGGKPTHICTNRDECLWTERGKSIMFLQSS